MSPFPGSQAASPKISMKAGRTIYNGSGTAGRPSITTVGSSALIGILESHQTPKPSGCQPDESDTTRTASGAATASATAMRPATRGVSLHPCPEILSECGPRTLPAEARQARCAGIDAPGIRCQAAQGGIDGTQRIVQSGRTRIFCEQAHRAHTGALPALPTPCPALISARPRRIRKSARGNASCAV